MRAYIVSIRETYADGYEWSDDFQIEASRPDVAARQALAWNRRTGSVNGHGRVVSTYAFAREAR